MARRNLEQVESSRTEHPTILELGHLLAAEPRPNSAGVTLSVAGTSIRLPDSLILALRDVIQHLSRGATIQVVPLDRELTPHEAAAVLGVSREFVRRLIERGQIPSRAVGAHQRLTLKDVHEYRERQKQRRSSALSDLREQSVELGAYDQ